MRHWLWLTSTQSRQTIQSNTTELQRGPKVASLVVRPSCMWQVRGTFASDSRMWRAHPAWMSRKCYAQNSQQCASCSAHLPLEEARNLARDVAVYVLLRIWAFHMLLWWIRPNKKKQIENRASPPTFWVKWTRLWTFYISSISSALQYMKTPLDHRVPWQQKN
jgi:hypothetical protein